MILFYKKGSVDSDKAKDLLKDLANITYVEESSDHKLLKEYSINEFPTLLVEADDDFSEDKYYIGLIGIEEFLETKNEYY